MVRVKWLPHARSFKRLPLHGAEKREAADRVAAELLEEEEREEAAQSKVRVAPPSPHIELHSVQLGGERCGVSVARVSASPLTE